MPPPDQAAPRPQRLPAAAAAVKAAAEDAAGAEGDAALLAAADERAGACVASLASQLRSMALRRLEGRASVAHRAGEGAVVVEEERGRAGGSWSWEDVSGAVADACQELLERWAGCARDVRAAAQSRGGLGTEAAERASVACAALLGAGAVEAGGRV